MMFVWCAIDPSCAACRTRWCWRGGHLYQWMIVLAKCICVNWRVANPRVGLSGTIMRVAWELGEREPGPVTTTQHVPTQLRPGDDFNNRCDLPALLTKHGWQDDGIREDGNQHWIRPGKSKGQGNAATLKDGIFYNFSSNGNPFEVGSPPGAVQMLHELRRLCQHRSDAGCAPAATRAASEPESGLRQSRMLF